MAWGGWRKTAVRVSNFNLLLRWVITGVSVLRTNSQWELLLLLSHKSDWVFICWSAHSNNKQYNIVGLDVWLFNHLQYFASDYSYFPTADQRPEVLASGVKLRIYYSCEYLLLHEVFAHYFMIFGLKKIGYVFFTLLICRLNLPSNVRSVETCATSAVF